MKNSVVWDVKHINCIELSGGKDFEIIHDNGKFYEAVWREEYEGLMWPDKGEELPHRDFGNHICEDSNCYCGKYKKGDFMINCDGGCMYPGA